MRIDWVLRIKAAIQAQPDPRVFPQEVGDLQAQQIAANSLRHGNGDIARVRGRAVERQALDVR